MVYNRRSFIKTSASGIFSLSTFSPFASLKAQGRKQVMTVKGLVLSEDIGITLPHEHVLVDFIGAKQASPERYRADEVFQKVLPYLEEVKKLGCRTFVECTPDYLGRDVALLKRLADASGLQIMTNTGYYGARNGIFLPSHIATETPEQIARHWIKEYEEGIDGTNIRPGFIKIGVDSHPLPEYNRKIVKAAALTHLATGLTIAAHTGSAGAAFEELDILQDTGVHPSAFIWVHAQEKGTDNHIKAAVRETWVEIDGISMQNYQDYAQQIKAIRDAGYLHKTLVSCDAGWYHVGEPGGGNYRTHATIFLQLLPELKRLGFSEAEVQQLVEKNPAEAFTNKIRKL